MSKRKERISAFLDNDLHHDELMSFSLSGETDDVAVAQRYQMVGDVLRDEMSEASFVDVSQAVREALANENIADAMTQTPAETISSDTAASSKFDWSLWFRPVTGMAVAASVAVVLVTTLSNQGENGVSEIADNATQQPVIQIASDSQSINQNAENYKTVDYKTMNLDPYINQHLEFATQDALQGRLPYARAVSFEQAQETPAILETRTIEK